MKDDATPRAANLAGQVVLVTGAGSRSGTTKDFLGVGAESAIALAAAGAQVALLDVDDAALQRTLDHAGSLRDRLLPVRSDVTDEDACRSAVVEVVERLGRITTLVNNVGTTGDGAWVTDATLDGWNSVLAVNLTSALLMSKYAVPEIARAGGGAVLNISSIGAIRGFGSAAYAASKGGMISLATSMAYAYGPKGIRVNTILPGHLATPMGQTHDAGARARRNASLLGTDGTAHDVANAVVFLASDLARWITGVALAVDGGTSMATALAMASRMIGDEEL